MVKAVCMFSLKEDINEKEFEEFFIQHVDIVKKFKNLKNYTIANYLKEEDKESFYRINELYFDSLLCMN